MQLAAESFARVLLILGVSGVASVSLATLMSYLRDRLRRRGDRGGS